MHLAYTVFAYVQQLQPLKIGIVQLLGGAYCYLWAKCNDDKDDISQ